MAFKPKQENHGEQFDFEAVNKTLIEQEEMIAFVTLNVDLGTQPGKRQVSYNDPKDKNAEEKFTVVETEEEAEELIEEVIEILGETLADKYGLDEMPEPNEDGEYELPFEIYDSKPCQEVAIFADSPECEVEYVEGQPVQYRHMFNKQFKGEVTGLKFRASAPQGKSKLWTFSPKSLLADLATKTGHEEIISEGDDNMDIDLWLGAPVRLNVTKKGDYPRFTVNKLGKRELKDAEKLLEKLEIEPMTISFEDDVDELVEKLREAKLRYGIIKKMKQAENFEGSNMEAALKILEAENNNDSDDEDTKKSSKKVTKKSSKVKKQKQEESEEEQEEQQEQKKKVTKKTAAKKKVKTKAKTKKKVAKKNKKEDNNGDFDDDIPF